MESQFHNSVCETDNQIRHCYFQTKSEDCILTDSHHTVLSYVHYLYMFTNSLKLQYSSIHILKVHMKNFHTSYILSSNYHYNHLLAINPKKDFIYLT